MGGLIGGAIVAAQLWSGPAPSTGARIDVLAAISGPRPERVQSGYQAPAKPAVTEAAPPAALSSEAAAPAAAEPTAVPTVEPGRATVAHTDGVGVVLRASPRDNDWTPRGFMDGTGVTILQRQGNDWAYIRGDNGQEGWVPARYLVAP
jgi:hypothetical protein